jgi:hypothetical protein
MNVCRLSWIKLTHRQELVPFNPNLKVLGLELSHAKVYTKIDLRGTHNLVCIQESDEWKWCYGHFEYVVMAFGITNGLAIFQLLMNDVFHEYFDDFVVYYINDILVFSKNIEDHEHHVRLVLENLLKVWLYAKLEEVQIPSI